VTHIKYKLDDTSNCMKLRGGPTQDEVMAIALQKLQMKEGDVFADLGCGTAKVAVEAARTASRVYAVDMRDEAIEASRKTIAANAADNVELIHKNSADFLRDCEPLDCAFIGGTRDLEAVLGLLAPRLRGRVVVNAVMISSLNRAVEALKGLDMFVEAIHVQVSRTHPIAGGVMFKPIDPVFIIVGEAN